MRHLGRVHRVDVAFLHQMVVDGTFAVEYTQSDIQAADIFTKAYANPEKWWTVCWLICHVDPAKFWRLKDRGVDDQAPTVLPSPEPNPNTTQLRPTQATPLPPIQ